MSKIFVKILDASILPASTMIVAKLIGLYITVKIFDIKWGIQTISDTLISSRPIILNTNDITLVSSYSDLFLLFVMLIGFSWQVIKAVYFHNTHVKPKIISRLAIHGLLNLIKSSFEVYKTATVWLIFLWLTNASIIINIFANKTEVWIGMLGLIVSIILSVILLHDASYEIHLSKLKNYNGK